MKTVSIRFVVFFAVLFVLSSPAAVLYVDLNSTNPVSPYAGWSTAATNIQDAIDASTNGDLVLVTNGVYAAGGKVISGVNNRIALSRAITVRSVNGPLVTTVRGAWGPVSTNGPAAIRCAWLTNGAVLSGFTLRDGATGSNNFVGDVSDSGGGVWCVSTNAVISNCEITNNSAVYGAGACSGTINNCYIAGNIASQNGGGALYSTLNNCTVVGNYCSLYYNMFHGHGAGAYDCVAGNCILLGNYSMDQGSHLYIDSDNYGYDISHLPPSATFAFCDTDPLLANTGDFNADPQFLDSFHIASTSPCRGAGSALYASGTDLDGEPWANPPSIGCDEVVLSNLVGPLAVTLTASQTNLLVSASNPFPLHVDFFQGTIVGRPSYVTWSFGDGPIVTNLGTASSYYWTNAGDYLVTFTAYNTDIPLGVSTNVLISVLPLNVPQLQSPALLTNGFAFQFPGQWSAYYTVQYATNLTPPVTWQTLQTIYFNTANVIQIKDTASTNASRFYRVLAQ